MQVMSLPQNFLAKKKVSEEAPTGRHINLLV